MKRFLIVLAFVVLFASPLSAADKAQKKASKQQGRKETAAVTAVTKQLADAGLSEEQSKKVKALSADYGSKLAAVQKEQKETLQAFRKAVADVLTDEQKAKVNLSEGKKAKKG